MSDLEDAMAIPRLAEHIGVTPRVLRYWEEQGLISPSRERGKLRYSPRDLAIARLIKRLMDAGVGVDGIRMLRPLAEQGIRRAAGQDDQIALVQAALQVLYERKAFREETGMEEEHYPDGPPPPPHAPGHGPPPPPGHSPPPPPSRGPHASPPFGDPPRSPGRDRLDAVEEIAQAEGGRFLSAQELEEVISTERESDLDR